MSTATARPLSELPRFRYLPDPIGSGVISANDTAVCPCCAKSTGWAYETEPYGPGEQPMNLCPWCIADGSAATTFGSEFVGDIDGEVSDDVEDEIMHRTPGFFTWQDDIWLTHCDDAAAYLGPVGWDRLMILPDAVAAVLENGWDEDALSDLRADGDATAYLFQCLHCGTHLAYADAS